MTSILRRFSGITSEKVKKVLIKLKQKDRLFGNHKDLLCILNFGLFAYSSLKRSFLIDEN